MIIEKLKRQDVKLYKELIDNCFGSSNELETYEKMYDEDSIIHVIVAKEDNIIVGSITYVTLDLFTYSNQPSIEIFNVATHSDYRRKGINKEIMEYILNETKEKGYKSVFLTCLETATGAHKFYESMGFKIMPSKKFYREL